MFPIILSAIAISLGVLFVLWPLIRQPNASGSDAKADSDRDHRQKVAQSRARQLDRHIQRIDQDVELGKISEQDAAETRALFERQLLQEIEREELETLSAASSSNNFSPNIRLAWIAIMGVALVGSGAMYWFTAGTPGMPGFPLAERQDLDLPAVVDDERRGIYQAAVIEAARTGDTRMRDRLLDQFSQQALLSNAPNSETGRAIQQLSSDEQMAQIRTMVDGLAARLEESPDDVAGWQQLARSYQVLGEEELELEALSQLIALNPMDIQAHARSAALLMIGQNPQEPLPARVVGHYRVIADANPDNAQANFFAGLGVFQSGDRQDAEVYWQRTKQSLPVNDPTSSAIIAEIDRLLDQD